MGNRKTAERRGRIAEIVSVILLCSKGYQILACRYKTPFGEVDIVARKGKSLIFIEVKYRQTHDNGASSITPHMRKRIEKAALAFVAARETPSLDMRFDAVVVDRFFRPKHIKSAWRPDFAVTRT